MASAERKAAQDKAWARTKELAAEELALANEGREQRYAAPEAGYETIDFEITSIALDCARLREDLIGAAEWLATTLTDSATALRNEGRLTNSLGLCTGSLPGDCNRLAVALDATRKQLAMLVRMAVKRTTQPSAAATSELIAACEEVASKADRIQHEAMARMKARCAAAAAAAK